MNSNRNKFLILVLLYIFVSQHSFAVSNNEINNNLFNCASAKPFTISRHVKKGTPTKLTHKIFKEIRNNDLHLIEKHLSSGFDPNYLLPNRASILFFVISRGSLDALKLFHKYGANLNFVHLCGTSPLMYAINAYHSYQKRLDKIRWLIKSEANVNQKDYWGNTPIVWAAANSTYGRRIPSDRKHAEFRRKVSWLLIKSGVQVDGLVGETALSHALREGQFSIAYALVLNGANPNTNIDGKSALMWAIDDQRVRLINILLYKGAKPNWRDNNGQTPLLRLLCRNIDKGKTRLKGSTFPLGNVDRSQHSIIKLLMKYHADIRVEDNSGLTVLKMAEKLSEGSNKDKILLSAVLKNRE